MRFKELVVDSVLKGFGMYAGIRIIRGDYIPIVIFLIIFILVEIMKGREEQ